MAKRRPSNEYDSFKRVESEEEQSKGAKKMKYAMLKEVEINESVPKCDTKTAEEAELASSEPHMEFNFSSTTCSFQQREYMCLNVVPDEEEADVIVEFDPKIPSNESNIDSDPAALSLQEVVEKLISNTSPSRSQIIIKKMTNGLCYSWLENNFKCRFPGKICTFEHNARVLFRKKFKVLPSNFLVQTLVDMRENLVFPDALVEGFDILRTRPNSQRFIPFLCFLAFYVSDVNDVRYLPFWADAASYFCTLVSSEDKTDGFAYLLKIFRLIDCTKQSKIIDFINMLKKPYFNLEITWKLLKSVIIFEMPSSLLIEAIESCNKNKVNVDEVHEAIVSRILVNNLSIHGVETLLRFCKTLEATSRFEDAKILKKRLLKKVQALETPIDKNLYLETYLYHRELDSSDSMPCKEENEDLDVERVLKSDKEKVQKRAFSPPPPYCGLNLGYFTQHSSFPSKFEGRTRPPHSQLKRSRKKNTNRSLCVPYDKLIQQVIKEIKDYEFTRAGEGFNLFQYWTLNDAAEHIVQTILQMKISSDEVLDFFNKVILACNSKNSATIISSIANTMMYFFVKCKQIDDWKTAYSILNICNDKEINLSLGKVLAFDGAETMSTLRIVLLLVEICLNNDKYEDAFSIIEKYNLFSACSFSKSNTLDDDSIRMNILKDFLEELIIHQSPLLCKTFKKAWEGQGDLQKDIDLAEYANEFLIASINDGDVEAFNDYRRLVPYNCLKETTIRAVVLALVQFGRIQEAEFCVESLFQHTYSLPLVNTQPIILISLSCWTEEEMFVVVNVLFNQLERCFKDTDSFHFEIFLQVVEEKKLPKDVKVYPKAFVEIDCSFESGKSRMLKVLRNDAFQFITFEDLGDRFIINSQSLKQHLEYRSQNRIASAS